MQKQNGGQRRRQNTKCSPRQQLCDCDVNKNCNGCTTTTSRTTKAIRTTTKTQWKKINEQSKKQQRWRRRRRWTYIETYTQMHFYFTPQLVCVFVGEQKKKNQKLSNRYAANMVGVVLGFLGSYSREDCLKIVHNVFKNKVSCRYVLRR